MECGEIKCQYVTVAGLKDLVKYVCLLHKETLLLSKVEFLFLEPCVTFEEGSIIKICSIKLLLNDDNSRPLILLTNLLLSDHSSLFHNPLRLQ